MLNKKLGYSKVTAARWRSRNFIIAICLSLLVLAGGVAAGWRSLQGSSEEPPRQTQSAASPLPVQSSASNPSKEYVYAGSRLVAIEENPTPGAPASGDTIGVFDPTSPVSFQLRNSNTEGPADIVVAFGGGGDKPIVGDWNGDGTDTVGVFRNGLFILSNSTDGSTQDILFSFGISGDQPVAGDWNGDGIDTIGLYRNGTFFLLNANSPGSPVITFELGIPGDVGIAGDWNGDGVDTTGVFRPTDGALYLKNANSTGFADLVLTYGLPGDKPVTGDWNGDGTDTIGIYRTEQVGGPTVARFYLRNSNTNGFADLVFAFGAPGDLPLAGDWTSPN